MRRIQKQLGSGQFKLLPMLMVGCVAVVLGGCQEPSNSDGEVINQLALPTDVVLDLACEDVGVHPETCVLADPANPFVSVTIEEFDVNNPDAPFNKFELAAAIAQDRTGAKARFYFWATALARFPSGENQLRTALALHELYDANSNQVSSDEQTRLQALKAYRSVLDNFFASVVVFTCCSGSSPTGDPVAFPVSARVLAADSIHRTERAGSLATFASPVFRRVIPGDPILALEQLLDWGYRYTPGTAANFFDDGVVEAIVGP